MHLKKMWWFITVCYDAGVVCVGWVRQIRLGACEMTQNGVWDLMGRKHSSLKPSASKSVQKTASRRDGAPHSQSPGLVRVRREMELRASEP